MDPFLVCVFGFLALYFIGWLWLEMRWLISERNRLLRERDEALDQRNRAINLAADMAEAVDKAGIDPMPELPNHPPPRTTGPAFRRNGGHLKRIQ